MSTAADAFATGLDLRAERRRRLRRSLRIAGPIVTLLVLIASIAGIGIYLHQANRADARVLTDDLLVELELRIIAEVVEFLEPAAIMVGLAERVLGDKSLDEQRQRLAEPLTGHMLKNNAQLAMFNAADDQGNFLMLKKMPDGAIHTKMMDRRGDEVDSRWIRRDAKGRVLGTEPIPADTYDPRTRPWYRGAVEVKGLYWSDVYVFFTDQVPGITASMPAYDRNGELSAVYAVDITLQRLSAFLSELKIGRNGRAMIIDNDGVFIAYPVLEQMIKQTGRGLERVHIEELADPVLNRAFDRFRVDGPGKREFTVAGNRYINTASSLEPILGRDWTLLIVAPEDDFVGFVTENNRRGLYMSAGVLALASLLAGMLVFQGLRADRNAQLVISRQRQLDAQGRAYSALATQAASIEGDDESAVSMFTETVARMVNARRVSIWHLTRDGRALVCEDSFDKGAGGHTGGMELTADELPELFESLSNNEEIVATDAAGNPRTAELHRIYLQPLACTALASVPIVHGERTVGVIWLEDDGDGIYEGSQDLTFARAVSSMLGPGMHARVTEAPARARDVIRASAGDTRSEIAPPMRETELVTARRAQALLARIAKERDEGAGIGAEVLEDITVVAMRFTDPVALATAVDEGGRNAIDNLVRSLESLAAECGVEYFKLLGDQIVCAAGFTEDPRGGAELMADFALGALDRCARLFTRLERPPEYQIGIDSGPVIGSAIGRDRLIFNLWGDAVVTATRMAETGIAGQIQATESSYQQLREDFLFRVRGRYYLEGIGEFTTYVLTGRL